MLLLPNRETRKHSGRFPDPACSLWGKVSSSDTNDACDADSFLAYALPAADRPSDVRFSSVILGMLAA